jgi:hypothetical protein
MQNKKIWTLIIIVAVIVGVASFYGGTLYEKSSLTKLGLLRSGANSQRQGSIQGGGQNRPSGFARGGANGQNGSFIGGSVIAKDDKSITVKAQDGSSKIVFFSGSTTVGKSVSGSASDLANGQQVMVNGTANPDGSVTAQNIQIRPSDQVQPGQ